MGRSSSRIRYQPLSNSADADEKTLNLLWQEEAGETRPSYSRRLILIILFSLIVAASLLYTVLFSTNSIHQHLSPSPLCPTIAVRKEWRDLSREEQRNYIQAVQCLGSKPSRVGLEQSLYDDFPYIHSQVGNSCTFRAS
jgi:tyrosinase